MSILFSDVLTNGLSMQADDARVAEVAINGVAMDSRQIEDGYLFLALSGEAAHGIEFIDAAIERGAVAVCVEPGFACELPVIDIPVIICEDLTAKAASIAQYVYGNESTNMPVFAVTGTNGKTTVTQLVAQLLSALECPTGVIGTLGWGPFGISQATGMTTPDVVAVQRMLSSMKRQGVKAVAMEVSSHALVQGRVDGVVFETAVFTNLSRDHLDYHGTMQAYQEAKASLFSWKDLKHAVINVDDVVGAELVKRLQENGSTEIITCSLKEDTQSLIGLKNIRFQLDGVTARINTPWGEGELFSPLLGSFNLLNLIQAIAVVALQGYPLKEILAVTESLHGVPGRMEMFGQGNDITVVVDYAHTPDALKNVLEAAALHSSEDLWCVFGCGGDRDTGKRPLMGSLAIEKASRVIVTNDNPRSENPEKIISDILSVLPTENENVVSIVDRRDAIRYAIVNAKKGDCVVIAGKGHESTQEIMGQTFPFDDRLEAQAALQMRGAA